MANSDDSDPVVPYPLRDAADRLQRPLFDPDGIRRQTRPVSRRVDPLARCAGRRLLAPPRFALAPGACWAAAPWLLVPLSCGWPRCSGVVESIRLPAARAGAWRRRPAPLSRRVPAGPLLRGRASVWRCAPARPLVAAAHPAPACWPGLCRWCALLLWPSCSCGWWWPVCRSPWGAPPFAGFRGAALAGFAPGRHAPAVPALRVPAAAPCAVPAPISRPLAGKAFQVCRKRQGAAPVPMSAGRWRAACRLRRLAKAAGGFRSVHRARSVAPGSPARSARKTRRAVPSGAVSNDNRPRCGQSSTLPKVGRGFRRTVQRGPFRARADRFAGDPKQPNPTD